MEFGGKTHTLISWMKTCMHIFVCHTFFQLQCKFQQFPFWQLSNLFFLLSCFLASSGEMYELHADGDPDGEAPRRLQRTGAVLLSGRTQVLHPLEALAQEWKGQEWVSSSFFQSQGSGFSNLSGSDGSVYLWFKLMESQLCHVLCDRQGLIECYQASHNSESPCVILLRGSTWWYNSICQTDSGRSFYM